MFEVAASARRRVSMTMFGRDPDESKKEPQRINKEADWDVRDSADMEDQELRRMSSLKLSGRAGLFASAESMKKQLRDHMTDPPYNVVNFYHNDGLAQRIARSHLFEFVTLTFIGINACWLAVDADWNDAASPLEAHIAFIIADNVFCFYFFVEWSIRFAAFARKVNCLKDAWFVFDSVLVVLMILETWVLSLFLLLSSGGKSSDFGGNMSILRITRVLRITRMARMARLLRMVPEFVILVKGMAAGMRSVFFTLSLLTIFCYVFAICLRQITRDTIVGDDYFSKVHIAMLSLLTHGTFLDDFASFIGDIKNDLPEIIPIIFFFVLISSLTLMNMLIGVLVEVVQAVAATEKEALTIESVKEKLVELMASQGLHTQGITQTEFVDLLKNRRTEEILSKMEVDVHSLVDLADFIFDELEADPKDPFEYDDGSKKLPFADFMELLLTMRKSNVATVKNIVDLHRFIGKQMVYIESLVELQTKRFKRVKSIDSTSKCSGSNAHGSPKISKIEGGEYSTELPSQGRQLSGRSVDGDDTSGSNIETNSITLPASETAMEKALSLKAAAEVQLAEERLQNFEDLSKRYCDNMSILALTNTSLAKITNHNTSPGATTPSCGKQFVLPPSDFHCQVDILQAALKQLVSTHERCLENCIAASAESLNSKLPNGCRRNKSVPEPAKQSSSTSLVEHPAGFDFNAGRSVQEMLPTVSSQHSPLRL